ncbi:MAG: PEP-CTERM sorting domain-containing protein [Phycisphaerales bacterium JB039]
MRVSVRTWRTGAWLCAGALLTTGPPALAQPDAPLPPIYQHGDQWVRAEDFRSGVHGSTALNPGPGFDGRRVWQYEVAHGGARLGTGNEWFRQETSLLTWDRDWWGIESGAWSYGDDTNPPIFANRMTHNIAGGHHEHTPIVRWLNPGQEMRVSILGSYEILWSGHERVGADVQVELVIAREDAAGNIDLLFTQVVDKPTPGLSIGDTLSVPVELGSVIGPGESLLFTACAVDPMAGVGRWVAVEDRLSITVVPAPSSLLLLAVGLTLALRRHR